VKRMKRSWAERPARVLCVAAVVLCGAASTQLAPAAELARDARIPGTAPVASLTGFVANEGQWDEQVLFFARQAGIEATLMRDALVLTPQRDPESDEPRPAPVVLRMPGEGAVALEGVEELPTRYHFLRGARAASDVASYAQVLYRSVAPGIDVLVRREATGFAYDLHVAPGADLSSFTLAVEGAHAPVLREDGVLVLETESGPLEQRIGAAWEIDDQGRRVDVASAFTLPVSKGGALRLGFAAPGRDPGRAFVLDPSLIFSTYIGGSGTDRLNAMDVAPDGSTYLTAQAWIDTPTTPGAFDTTSTSIDAWVGKLSPDGTTLEWATFLGGVETEFPFGVHRDTDGTIVVAGQTWSADFPSTPGTIQPTFVGGEFLPGFPLPDLFVTRLVPDGSALVWSTFYGGSEAEGMETTALLPGGDLLAVGPAWDPLPTSPPPGSYDTEWDPDDWYVLRVSADGTAIIAQTYFPAGIGTVEVGPDGNLYLAGSVLSAEDPLFGTPGAFQEEPAPGSVVNGFVAKMDPLATEILWATYLGGSATDNIVAMALDGASAIYVTGSATSSDFPTTEGAFDTVLEDGDGFYVAKLQPNGSDLVWSTFLESVNAAQAMWAIAVDRAGNAVVSGSTNGPDFPTTPDAFQPDLFVAGAAGDATLTKLDAFGETLEYSTYFGGSGTDWPFVLGFDSTWQLRMGLFTWSSSNYFVTPGAYDTTYNGGGDLGLTAWDLDLLPWTVLGGGLAGSTMPNLAGTGALTPGAPTRFSLRGGLSGASSWFVLGLEAIDAPFKGGTLVPAPTLLAPLVPDAQGALDLVFPWPTVPAGLELFVQAWLQDPGGPKGWSASNALQLVSQ